MLRRTAMLLRRVGDLEDLQSKEVEIGPVSAGLFALSCAGMLSVGFGTGVTRQFKKHSKDEIIQGSLRERVNPTHPSSLVPKQAARASTAAPPTMVAARALGYATVLTVSTATAVLILGKWYFRISDTEDLIGRLKRGVPEKSDTLKYYVGPPLESLRDGLQSSFSVFRPLLAPKGNDATLTKTLEQERRELEKLGVDVSILDPIPEVPRNIGRTL